jgi:hypothetical protein
MARTIPFHLDENCPHAIAEGLRRRGIDVTTTPDADLVSASDEEQTAYAFSERRVIFTLDKDFLRINASHVPHAGFVFCRQGKRGIGGIILGLACNEPTGAVKRNPSRWPPKFATVIRLFGSSPVEYNVVVPPRQAYSHSASVGKR